MNKQELIGFLTKRMTEIQSDEDEFQESALPNETMQFSTKDVLQELTWVLEKLTEKYFLFKYEVKDGESSYRQVIALSVPEGKTPEEVIHTWLSDFFGLTTTQDKDNSNTFWEGDGNRAVREKGWKEISKEEYDFAWGFGLCG